MSTFELTLPQSPDHMQSMFLTLNNSSHWNTVWHKCSIKKMKLFPKDTARDSDNVILFPVLLCVNFWAANFTNEHRV